MSLWVETEFGEKCKAVKAVVSEGEYINVSTAWS